MIELIPLFKATLGVSHALSIGDGPAGTRLIGEIGSAVVEGDRLRAALAGAAAADWMVRAGSIAVVDVRLTLKTHDDALIYMTYGGRLDLASPPGELFAYVAPTFETGDQRYAWLNRIQAVGKGLFTPAPDGGRLEYEFYELR
jgi:hypothetical protein